MIVYKTELLKSLSLDDMVKRINKIIVQFENSVTTYKKKRHYFMNNGGKKYIYYTNTTINNYYKEYQFAFKFDEVEIDNNVLTAKGGRIEIKIEESSYAKIIFCIDNDFMWQIYDGYYSKDGTFVFDIMKVGVE